MTDFPLIEHINKTLTELNEISLQVVSYDAIFEKSATELRVIPFVTMIQKRVHYIERVRKNEQEQICNFESDISYKRTMKNKNLMDVQIVLIRDKLINNFK